MKINLNRDELMKKKGIIDKSQEAKKYQMNEEQEEKLSRLLLDSTVTRLRESSKELSFLNSKEEEEEK